MSDFRNYDFGRGGSVSTVAVRNRVLRNVYWLLALSMIPTVFGAWLGLVTGFTAFSAASPGVTLILFFAVAFGLMYLIERNKDSGVGVALLLVFTLFMGVMLSRIIGMVLGLANGASLIMLAFGGTGVVFAAMATIATVSKRDFSKMASWLMMGVFVIIIASLANIWLQLPALVLTVSVLALVIFSAFLLVDVQRVVNGGETNYVTATLAIYLDLYNIFTSLLSILSIFGGGSNRN
ncbi:Bax inhibitor-1/YccA family protein [Robbsia sp. KACC 23696]|uniref:Bax inhibitor-1/YccA family protein n=1 Tax=Robbsia sp. KACC 23696 TaxID=3149231 RepID=UPI00325AE62A